MQFNCLLQQRACILFSSKYYSQDEHFNLFKNMLETNLLSYTIRNYIVNFKQHLKHRTKVLLYSQYIAWNMLLLEWIKCQYTHFKNLWYIQQLEISKKRNSAWLMNFAQRLFWKIKRFNIQTLFCWNIQELLRLFELCLQISLLTNLYCINFTKQVRQRSLVNNMKLNSQVLFSLNSHTSQPLFSYTTTQDEIVCSSFFKFKLFADCFNFRIELCFWNQIVSALNYNTFINTLSKQLVKFSFTVKI